MSEPNFEIMEPAVRIDDYIRFRVDDQGAMNIASDYGPGNLGARITSKTRCTRCHQTIGAGERLTAHLREDFDEAPVEHDGPCPAQRSSGSGMTS